MIGWLVDWEWLSIIFMNHFLQLIPFLQEYDLDPATGLKTEKTGLKFVKEEWKLIAVTLDRLFLILALITMCAVSIAMMTDHPGTGI